MHTVRVECRNVCRTPNIIPKTIKVGHHGVKGVFLATVGGVGGVQPS